MPVSEQKRDDVLSRIEAGASAASAVAAEGLSVDDQAWLEANELRALRDANNVRRAKKMSVARLEAKITQLAAERAKLASRISLLDTRITKFTAERDSR